MDVTVVLTFIKKISLFLYVYCAKYFIYLSLSDDYNRVVLEPDGDGYDEGDYINASYVDVSALYHSHLSQVAKNGQFEFDMQMGRRPN